MYLARTKDRKLKIDDDAEADWRDVFTPLDYE
jgi:hypothetical protein